MNLGALFCLLLAHFIADFPLQFKQIVDMRNSTDKGRSILGNSLHAGIHLLVSLISVIYFWSSQIFVIIIIVSVLHWMIDFIKSTAILASPFRKYSTGMFLIDQVCHLSSIFLVLNVFNRNPTVWLPAKMIKSKAIEFFNNSIAGVTYFQKVTLSLILLIVGLWGVGIFIRILLDNLSLKPYKLAINLKIELVNQNKNYGAASGGFIIGLLERLFIILSIAFDMPLVIGFILAAKSVARLKKFDDDKFVEIFIIGSFTSFISAILIGYVIRLLKILPY